MAKPTKGQSELDDVKATREELDDRITYCEYMAQPDFNGFPNSWSDIFAAIALWLTSQYQDQWEDIVEDGLVHVKENDYDIVIDGHLEDYALQDIYENGYKSSYAWMLGSRSLNPSDFDQDMIAYSEEMGLATPEWLEV